MKQKFIGFALVLLSLLCSACGANEEPIPESQQLPVLMYHHVVENGQPCNEMTVTVERMEKDLKWLSEHGYHSILPRQLAEGETLPEKAVLITFDDGYRSNYELLYPLLKQYEMKAVISPIVLMQNIGATNFISWEMCREMTASSLVEIGSHSYSLHNLGDLSGSFDHKGINGIQRDPEETDERFEKRVLNDIQHSYDLIQQEVGVAPVFFAYPFGVREPEAEALIHDLFPVTAITESGTADLRNGLHNLPRFTITMEEELDHILPQ